MSTFAKPGPRRKLRGVLPIVPCGCSSNALASNHWFDASAFELQPQGTIGSTPRNFLRGPGFANVDMSLVKNQALDGNTRPQFRLGVFNVLHGANYAVPKRAV